MTHIDLILPSCHRQKNEHVTNQRAGGEYHQSDKSARLKGRASQSGRCCDSDDLNQWQKHHEAVRRILVNQQPHVIADGPGPEELVQAENKDVGDVG